MIRDNDKIYTLKELWDRQKELKFKPHYLPEIQTLDGVNFISIKDQVYSYTGGVQIRYLLMNRSGDIINMDSSYTYEQMRDDYVLIRLSCSISAYSGQNITIDYICFVNHINIEMIVNTSNESECRIISEAIDKGSIIRSVSGTADNMIVDSYVVNEMLSKYLVDERIAEVLFRTYFE